MNTNLKIKVCGMRDPQNIKAIDNLNPEYLGFIFYPPSPRNMDKSFGAIPDTQAKRVGVFVNECIETMIKRARNFRLTTLQLHGNESPEVCAELVSLGYEVIKSFKVDDSFNADHIENYIGVCTYFLYDTKGKRVGGTGKKFNWDKLKELAPLGKFFLSGGIGPEDAEKIMSLNLPNLVGIDINSRFEIEPGLKDEEKLKDFFKIILRDRQPAL